MKLPDMSITAGDSITLFTILTTYYGTSSPSPEARTNYGQGEVSIAHLLQFIVCRVFVAYTDLNDQYGVKNSQAIYVFHNF